MESPSEILALHSVAMLRDLARKWWQLEVGLADRTGRVTEAAWGPVPPDGNDFCRAVRGCNAGRRRCQRSVKEALRRLTQPRERSPVLHTCHLGLTVCAGAVFHQGRIAGLLFACGFSSREPGRSRIARLRGAVAELRGRRFTIEGQRIPVLSRDDVERLRDLLAYAAEEVAASAAVCRNGRDESPEPGAAFAEIVARSPSMARAVDRLRRAIGSNGPVLLEGEPGTGKRTLARALHRAGPGGHEPFAVFAPCADPLTAEQRLFGVMRGGSLGRAGLLEATGRGTVYLSAGSWLAQPVQIKLLRVLREGSLVPLGGERPRPVAARLLLALEGSLDGELAAGRLRADLADRLADQRVAVPPLRERREDLEPLIDLLLRRLDDPVAAALQLPAATRDLLLRYRWPGNAAELDQELRQLLAHAASDGGPAPEAVSVRIRQAAGYGSQALTKALRGKRRLKDAVAILERELIQEGLIRTRWNKSQLARELGISRSNLLAKLARYGLDDSGGRGQGSGSGHG